MPWPELLTLSGYESDGAWVISEEDVLLIESASEISIADDLRLALRDLGSG